MSDSLTGPNKPPTLAGLTRMVGLGASAGGLDALEQFFAHVPAHSGLAYVVVQHMDPTHKTLLTELLQRVTVLPVREAGEAMRIEPDVIYVIPPNTELSVAGGLLHLADPAQPRGRRLPIDVLLTSMAQDQGKRAIGVVLSGMGSDGTLGLQAIKAAGGLCLAQQPESAQFDSMPRSAVAAGGVDIVAPPAELPGRIVSSMAGTPPAPVPEPAAALPDVDEPTALDSILGLLRARSKHDLRQYKSSTLLRRIERRITLHGLPGMPAYVDFLRQNPQEVDLLFKEMLIGVTAFFRDPPVWEALQNSLLPTLLAQRAADPGPLRAWVAGCSTGEEAYTLAMVFKQVTEALPEHRTRTLQIFATDLNADAIALARKGHYGASIARDLPPACLNRFFKATAGGYQIDPLIRETVLFARHDVTVDPPFTKLDILSCRNLMIYFDAALQSHLVPLFHYSLRPGGLLMLGGSETVGRAQALFEQVHPKSRLYWRSQHATTAGQVDFQVHMRTALPTNPQEAHVPPTAQPVANLQTLADQVLLQVYSPPAVLVNPAGDIVYISGRTGKYLEPAAGKANWNIHVMARPGLRTQLGVALRTAVAQEQAVELSGLCLDDDTQLVLDITVQALQEPKALAGMVMIVFRERTDAPPASGPQPSHPAKRSSAAAHESLLHAQEEVRALRQEMRASQEELQAANEELQSTNEELQSANEELTTSKEESQSMNEELQTINSEMQTKLDELALAQSDMQNLLNSTDIATLFLDKELNVRRFTERVTRIIHLRESDIGRPLSDLTTTLLYPQLHADATETLRTLAFCEKQIATSDGHWYSVRIMPYRTLTDVIQGAVITFVDITVAKELESRLRKA